MANNCTTFHKAKPCGDVCRGFFDFMADKLYAVVPMKLLGITNIIKFLKSFIDAVN